MKINKLMCLPLALILMSGCSVNKISQQQSGDFQVASMYWDYAESRTKAYESAQLHCSARGGGIQVLREIPYEGRNGIYLHFRCFNYAQKQAEERRNQEARVKEEARQNALREEEQRRAALQRSKEQEEWEKSRPQREAEEKRRQEAENRRRNSICPSYNFARQTCATAGEFLSPLYKSCMNIRFRNEYSEWDDRICFNRK